MMRSLWTAATGMYGQQTNIDVISNNLANVNTTGFKKSRVDFKDLFYQIMRQPGVAQENETELPVGQEVGLGVKPEAIFKIFTSSGFQQTENPLDLAIEGDGFFQITMPDGTLAYTRDGSFKMDSEGRLLTSDGYLLEPAITIPNDAVSVSVSRDGTVNVTNNAGVITSEGQIELARFVNPSGLSAQGNNLFKETPASGTPVTGIPGNDGIGSILPGYLESSNVNVVEEMVKLITAQRAYELNSKAVQTSEDMLSVANNMKR